MLIAKSAYNNTKNISTDYLLFQLNYGYNPQVYFKKKVNYCSKVELAEILFSELTNLITIYPQNFLNIQNILNKIP